MGAWVDWDGTEWEWNDPMMQVDVTDNPVIYELLDANGRAIRQWVERPPIGFR